MANTTPTIPLDLLACVNVLLDSISLSPVMSLNTEDGNTDSAAAKRIVDAVTLELQQEAGGWWFNKEPEVVLAQNGDGEVLLPSNILSFKPLGTYSGAISTKQLVQRDGKVYDRKGRTYTIGEAVTASITLALEFSDLPAQARWYITCAAARRFGIPRSPNQATFQFTEDMESKARIALEQADAEAEGNDLQITSPHFAKHARGRKVH